MDIVFLCMLLVCVLLMCHNAMSRQYPLNLNFTYRFLRKEKNDKVDLSNPFRFNFINTKEIIDQWGYRGEQHNVTTEDGYIISIYRIRPKREPSPPVLLMHGLLASSETYVIRGPGEDLSFLLSEAGYDVWLGNVRGGYNGKGHVNMSSDDENFWKFSYHENGMYDIPAFIDYILELTGFSKLTLAGHSLANAMTMVMTSERPEYNQKLNLYVAMAPYVFADHMRFGPLLVLAIQILKRYCYRFRRFEIFERRSINPNVRLCDIIPYFCLFLSTIVVGPYDVPNDATLTPMLLAYTTSGTNLFTLIHTVDSYRRRRFGQLDLGKVQNRLRYNSDAPPDYDLSRVTVPVQIYAGVGDYEVAVRDVATLARTLPNVVEFRVIPYNHIDFIGSPSTKEVLYNHMIDVIGRYSQAPVEATSTPQRTPR